VPRRTWKGVRAVVLGLGRFGGGLGVARWLLAQGALVTVTDRLEGAELGPTVAELAAAGATLALGGHDGVDVRAGDVLVVNPAVPLDAPLVVRARAAGADVTSEIALLVERWPGPIVGVTGSNGKSTTVSLCHALLEAAGAPVVLGGNLGGSLLPRLATATAEQVAVLELSSFMLELLGELDLGPRVAVVTNLSPNHLDRHGTMEAYREAKAAIVRRSHLAVLNADDAEVAAFAARAPGEVRWFGGWPGAGADLGVDADGHLRDRDGRRLLSSSAVPLAGRMNRLDLAAAALAAAAVTGRDSPADLLHEAALARFRAPPHRLQEVPSGDALRWLDDSVSTTPESTAASLEAVGEPCILIVGGRDKGLDPSPLLVAAERARRVLTIGERGADLARALNRRGIPAEGVNTVEAAVERAARVARPGETILFSPGYSSHDQFANFEQRAAAFAAAVGGRADPERLSRQPGEC